MRFRCRTFRRRSSSPESRLQQTSPLTSD